MTNTLEYGTYDYAMQKALENAVFWSVAHTVAVDEWGQHNVYRTSAWSPQRNSLPIAWRPPSARPLAIVEPTGKVTIVPKPTKEETTTKE